MFLKSNLGVSTKTQTLVLPDVKAINADARSNTSNLRTHLVRHKIYIEVYIVAAAANISTPAATAALVHGEFNPPQMTKL